MKLPVKVAWFEQTCDFCPAQWEGVTDDKRPVYVRYRWGSLAVSVGPPGGGIESAVRGEIIHSAQIGGFYDGDLKFEHLEFYTKGIVEWPA